MENSNGKCCNACINMLPTIACSVKNCKCHTPSTDTMEDRLDTELQFAGIVGTPRMIVKNEVKRLIAKERTQAKKEFADELRGKINSEQAYPKCDCSVERSCHGRCGKSFNQALIRILALLPEQNS